MTNVLILLAIILDLVPSGSSILPGLDGKIVDVNKQKDEVKKPLVLPVFQPLPYKNSNYGALQTTSKGLLITDLGTGQVLEERNKDTRLSVASLTKLMTAKLVLKETSLSKSIKVTAENIQTVQTGDSTVGLASGDEVTYENLLKGLLISSGSDCALVIANNLYPGGYQSFVEKMNAEAKQMNLSGTNFTNPVGWDEKDNFSTPKDISTLTRVLLRDETFRKITSTRNETIYTIAGKPLTLTNTNLILDNLVFHGVKTGYTGLAGECLVSLSKAKGHDILITLVGSEDRFGETKSILNWVNLVYNW